MLALAAVMAFAALQALVGGVRAGSVEPPEIVEISLEPDTATVGDRLTLTIVVEHHREAAIDGPGFGADFGGLQAVDVARPRTEGGGERVRTTFGFTLVAFDTGEFTVPPLDIPYRNPDGTDGRVTTPQQSVTVESVLAPGEDEPRDLKPQLDIPGGAPLAVVPAAFVVSFLALTVFAFWLVGRALQTRPAPTLAPPPLPPHERARRDLASVAADPDVKRRYAALAHVVRRYLSERFDYPAYAMTRTEIEAAMLAAGIDRWPARLTANLLEQTDAVQFAGFRPPPERLEADLTAAYEIVALTEPREPADGEPEPAGV
jgi:hypothetical protein